MGRRLALLLLMPLAAGCGVAQSPGESVTGSVEKIISAGSSRVLITYETREGKTFQENGVFDFERETGTLGRRVITPTAFFAPVQDFVGTPELRKRRWVETDVPAPSRSVLQRFAGSPRDVLLLLSAVGDAEKVETGEERDEAVTRYRARLNVRGLLEALSGEAHEGVRWGCRSGSGKGSIPVDVALDAKGRPRQIDLAMLGEKLTIELLDYGVKVDAKPPPSDDVLTYAELLEQAGGSVVPGPLEEQRFVSCALEAARVTSEAAGSDDVHGRLLYAFPRGEADFVVRLVVDRAGERVLDELVPSYPGDFEGMRPATTHVGGDKAIAVQDLDGDGEPEILLGFYWGGTHCCWWSRIYHWDAGRSRYATLAHLWGNVGVPRLADLDRDGRTDFVSADNHFAYEFTSFAGSSFPLQIWTYHGGTLIDATRAYPALIAKDADKQWRRYREALAEGEVRGFLAAWAADECLLGRCEAALATLRPLSDTFSGPYDESHSGSATAYLLQLRAFLDETGYLVESPASAASASR
jgi:hypothetical protein